MINVSYEQLINGQQLSDGDIVSLVVADGGDPNMISVALVLQGVTWWKGIQSNTTVLCQSQDSQSTSSATLPASQVQSDGLQLWKAKTFGVHIQMYNIENPRTWANGGKVYTFIWQKD
ncbi:hypothetical protein [Nostoc sp. FACHB-133]|uniref:hypothetical protein n=1 Tax=Nostoc sp. FACHB-133 TaxID=2692835 RepID=UPI0016872873|nr:hypothetical protein [Nostoc sp. FACHB-133]MBD2526905.1 hypothetical protein [Nostoc sp. FACHB-133]